MNISRDNTHSISKSTLTVAYVVVSLLSGCSVDLTTKEKLVIVPKFYEHCSYTVRCEDDNSDIVYE